MNEGDQKISKKIGKVYEMLFPYGEYDYNPVKACYSINRELKNLCNDKMRHILIIIAKYLKYKIKHDTSTQEICQMIQNDIYDKCFNLSNENDKSKLILALSGAVGVFDDRILGKTCTDITNEITEISKSEYVVGIFLRNIPDFANEKLVNIPEWSIILKRQPDLNISKFKFLRDVPKTSEELYKKGYDNNKDLLTTDALMKMGYYHRDKDGDMSYRIEHVKFIQNILKRIYDGEISPSIKWNELC